MQPSLKGDRSQPLARGRLDRLPSRSPSRSMVATHRALFREEGERRCDLCEAPLAAGEEDGGSGLYVWTRGEEVRYEEPPLCTRCGPTIAVLAERRFEEEEEEEG